ncbi:MAG: M24 family metallopeptidase, partial [Opitutales bacterium]
HGVGKSLHEEPQIPNYGKAGSGPVLKRGLTVAIEPMVNMRKKDISIAEDGWTALTVDGMPSAHFEHTVMVDKDRPEILTLPEGDKRLQVEEKA